MTTQTLMVMVAVAGGLGFCLGALFYKEEPCNLNSEELLEDAKYWCQYCLRYSSPSDSVYKTFQKDLEHIKNGNIRFNKVSSSVGIPLDFLLECAKSWRELPEKQKDFFFSL